MFLPNEIMKDGPEFDYIIVCSEIYYRDICAYASDKLGLNRKKIIKGSVLNIPHFNWNKYIELYNKNISIIAETCWGGVLSHILGLEFCSPFVNVRVGIERGDYYKLLNKLDFYMQCSPQEKAKSRAVRDDLSGWEGRIDFPVLWYDDILLHGFHYRNQEDFFETWEKRRKRYRTDRKIIVKILYNEKDIELFEKIECERKIGFYYKEIINKDIIYIPFSESMQERYAYQYASYLIGIIQNGELFTYIDIFSLLNK